jgi:low temperature requirement protein LtrA
VEGHVDSVAGWAALVAAMVLTAALWWLYFDAAAEINLKVLQLSGGSPVIARTIFAAGHMLPAFALIIIAAGVALLLEGEPPRLAYALPAVGLGLYLIGTRVTLVAASRLGGVVRVALLVVTFGLGWYGRELSPREYLWLLTAWAIGCAALATLGSRGRELPGSGLRA